MWSLIKQMVNVLATPLVLASLIAVIAVAFRWRERKRTAQGFAVLALAIAYFGALNPVATVLLGSLEREYPPLRDDPTRSRMGFIVVLGSDYQPRDDIPVTAALDSDGLVRIVEGIRLSRRFPEARLVVSGGAAAGRVPSAVGYEKLARSLGVDEASLVVLTAPLNTQQEVIAVAPVVGVTPFVLVTSAYHMPRAMLLMKRAGLNPVPAPTGHRIDRLVFGLRSLLPDSRALASVERALHEYIGLLVLAMSSG